MSAIGNFSTGENQLYYIKKPQTAKYDIYNATTGQYFEYDLDEEPTYYGDGKGYSADTYRIVKDGKMGMLKNDGSILYEAVYDEIDRSPYNQYLSDEMKESDDLIYGVIFATVKNGKVKAKKNAKGKKVEITAMATDGSGKKKSVTIKIR